MKFALNDIGILTMISGIFHNQAVYLHLHLHPHLYLYLCLW